MNAPRLDPDLLALLACPACDSRPPLREDAAASQLVCDTCRRHYAISVHGFPVLLQADELKASDRPPQA